MPLISIVIPLYNKERFIKETLDSVFNQSFTDYEIIIVNDGSTDSSVFIVNAIEDQRITVLSNQNKGVSHARNFGISKANSDLIALLDGDDLWEPNHLENLYNLYEKFPDCGLYATAYNKKYFNGEKIKASYNGLAKEYFGIIEDYFSASIKDSIAWTSAVLIPMKTFRKVGVFDEEMRSGQDTDLWIRIALKDSIAFSSIASSNKIILAPKYHLSYSTNRIDRLKLFEKFKAVELPTTSFKKYMDLNRFSVAIERKIAKDYINYRRLRNGIDPLNLNFKQRIILNMPSILIGLLKRLQNTLLRCNIYLSPFK
ncbi:MAG: glycosyltransferase [Flavobacteriaceae bacterium]|mgnify:FL=1|jgi:glycosyltransferase involved in cell wall biosynthesis|tara:strand:- start:4593 stop:5531 length:939 start_codon:yes stop_codon:yes gene_type:complete